MDREHPIPQEVSTYEFRLVGDMTIKQFVQVAAGALISLVIYSSGMPSYVKWPLIIFSFLSGIALAFFPIQDRPLGKWIILFVKAIYSPTVYVWDKNARRSEYFQPEPADALTNAQPAVNQMQQPSQTQIMTTSTLPQDAQENAAPEEIAETSEFDKNEAEFLSKVNKQFDSSSQPTPPQTIAESEVTEVQEIPAAAVKKPQIPINTAPQVVQEQKTVQQAPSPYQAQSGEGGQVSPMTGQVMASAKAATYSQEAAPPSPPTKANVIVGQVMDSQGKIVDGAILEIKDNEGRSVRALRSNRLGHFMIVTPLVNGKYQITVEKDGYTFDPVSFEANDRIIPPIAIWAKE